MREGEGSLAKRVASHENIEDVSDFTPHPSIADMDEDLGQREATVPTSSNRHGRMSETRESKLTDRAFEFGEVDLGSKPQVDLRASTRPE